MLLGLFLHDADDLLPGSRQHVLRLLLGVQHGMVFIPLRPDILNHIRLFSHHYVIFRNHLPVIGGCLIEFQGPGLVVRHPVLPDFGQALLLLLSELLAQGVALHKLQIHLFLTVSRHAVSLPQVFLHLAEFLQALHSVFVVFPQLPDALLALHDFVIYHFVRVPGIPHDLHGALLGFRLLLLNLLPQREFLQEIPGVYGPALLVVAVRPLFLGPFCLGIVPGIPAEDGYVVLYSHGCPSHF